MVKPAEFDPHESSIGLKVHKVPNIRVFGSTMCGQQVCLHLHGYLPYFYLPVPKGVNADNFRLKVHKTLDRVARSFLQERAFTALRRRHIRRVVHGKFMNTAHCKEGKRSQMYLGLNYDPSSSKSVDLMNSLRSGTVNSKVFSQSGRRIELMRRRAGHAAHIHRVDIVEHVPFYGYHTQPKKFFKVYHYDPGLTKHLAGYCLHTGICKHKLQPHEVHISYLMHFVSDYNIKGMDYIYLSSAIKMRAPLPLFTRSLIQPHSLWQQVMEASRKLERSDQNIYMKPILRNSPSVFLSQHKKTSNCELEIDAHIATVLNAVELNKGLMQANQELSQFAVGGYMGASNCFFERWEKQCARLNEASISSFHSSKDMLMTFASKDTLSSFYRFLIKKSRIMDKENADLVGDKLQELIYRVERDTPQRMFGFHPKSRVEELIKIDPIYLHSMEEDISEDMDPCIYTYRYLVDPPKVECYEAEGDSKEISERQEPEERPTFTETEPHASTSDMSQLQGAFQNPNEQQEDEIIDESKLTTENFDCGIVLDVITDIELNRIYPDPKSNSIIAVAYTLRDHRVKEKFQLIGMPYADGQGVIIVNPHGKNVETRRALDLEEYMKYALIQRRNVNMNDIERSIYSMKYTDISYVSSEVQLLVSLRSLILSFDPNIIYGYDLARSSIGYINQRAEVLGMPGFIESISRVIPRARCDWSKNADEETDNSTRLTHQNSKLKKRSVKESAIKPLVCVGRLMFDLMDVAVRELNMADLTLENIIHDQLGYTMPSYHMYTLNKWIRSKYHLMGRKVYGQRDDKPINWPSTHHDDCNDMPNAATRNANASPHAFRCIRHILLRNYAVIAVLDRMMYFQKYTTFSRLYGIDLKSTIVRGSQYHVESILVRFTKSSNYILPSPAERQVHEQRPSTFIPIVMQPISGFHVAPVAVLDFQSLYSCITIAYNICYSTCLGLLSEHIEKNDKVKLGVTTYYPEKDAFSNILIKSQNNSVYEKALGVHIMPNGVMFVDKHVREGVLPTMLKSVLYSRRKIKAAMAKNLGDELTMQQWHHEQYGLKMISNLSVGLTASGFSGRMPCSDLAESVVSIARALILFCIELVHEKFDAQVIYGDTDSIFIKFEGRTVEEAQELANRIADAINSSIPEPIKILPQKVYSPCALLSKKRYVGLAHSNGTTTFDDKGIETMRKSECNATRNILKEAIESVFKRVSLDGAFDELMRIFKSVGAVYSPKDFILYRQIRLGTYSEELDGKAGTLPAAAIVAKHKMRKHYGDRILENEYIPHVFSLSRGDEQRGIKESAVFPNEICGIFKATDYIKEIGHRTLPQNSITNIVEQVKRAEPLKKIDVDYYLMRQVFPPLKRMLQLMDVNPNLSITQEVFKRLTAVSTVAAERQEKIVRSTSQAKDIWLYTGKHAKCVGCGTPCTIKLGQENNDDIAAKGLDASFGHFVDAIQNHDIRLRSLQPYVLSFESTDSKVYHIIICDYCRREPKKALLNAVNELNTMEKKLRSVNNICLNCTGSAIGMASCQNAWHCDVYFKRISYKASFSRAVKQYRGLLTLAYTS